MAVVKMEKPSLIIKFDGSKYVYYVKYKGRTSKHIKKETALRQFNAKIKNYIQRIKRQRR